MAHKIAEEGRSGSATSAATSCTSYASSRRRADDGPDDEHRAEVELQKVTDARIQELDEVLSHKEADILEV